MQRNVTLTKAVSSWGLEISFSEFVDVDVMMLGLVVT